MILIKTQRVIKAGFLNFWRNGWISLAAIFMMVITLFTIGSLLYSRMIFDTMLTNLQDKVDISVYFKEKTNEAKILSLQKMVEVLPEVKSVEYVSSEQVLEQFNERHKDNALISKSVEVLGKNPFGAVFNIKAKEISKYEGIANFLNSETETIKGEDSIIDKINYFQNKKIIDSLSNIVASAKKLGASLSLIMALVSILVIFNTIGLVIHSSKEEIEVMRLVGASNKFISGPFVVEGAMYGLISAIIAMVLFYPATLWLGPATKNFFSGIDIFGYYVANFGQFFLILLGSGIALGVVSSFMATRRYLKI